MILSCSNIKKSFGTTEILKNITFKIENNEKLAIIGVNGAGKSTLMRILANEEEYDSGDIFKPKDATMGYLSQETSLDLHSTIYQSMLDEFQDVIALEARLRKLEEEMQHNQDVYTEYDELTHQFQELDGYSYPSWIRRVLIGLGFTEDEFKAPISTMSGGQKTRVSLGKLLLRTPSILLLDEPTNHLDAKAIEWLENYLKGYRKAIIVISHDRYFIDQFCNSILEINHGKSYLYRGNYSFYVQTKNKNMEIEMKHYQNQQKIIKKQEESIAQLKSFNREKSVKRAESKDKQLEKMEMLERPEEEPENIRLLFKTEVQSGYDVLKFDHLSFGYDKPLFDHLSLDIKRQDRVALIGPNGIGKTTLFKILLNELKPASGKIKYGSHVTMAYYDQEHTSLSPNKTIFSEIQDTYPNMNNTQVRSLLARFQFKNEDVFKEINMLSGGEKGRVVLAKLLLTNANFLILDEPTNHLDIASKEILEEALINYEGTVFFISHDRYFINRVATRIVEMNAHELINFDGNYDHYLLTLNASKETVKKAPTDYLTNKQNQQALRKIKNRIRSLEENISSIEQQINDLKAKQESDEIVSDYIQYNKIGDQIEELEMELLEKMEQWEEASKELEE